MDFTKYFSQRIYRTDMWKMDFKEHFIFWFTKCVYVFLFVGLPIYVLGFMPWLVGFLSLNITMGFALAIVFQLAHVVEHAHFEMAYDDKHIEEEWAKYQVLSTANFAPKNAIVNWYVGGLNFQIEHHLFPRVSHVHYPAISKIVKDVCKDFNIHYNEFRTMRSAVVSHFKMMKEFGKKPMPIVANA